MRGILLMKNYRFKNNKVIHIIKKGIKICLLVCLVAVFILQVYCEKGEPDAFYIGISLIKSGMFFISMFIICGFIFDKV